MAKDKELTPEESMHHLYAALQLYGLAQATMLDQFAALQDRRAQRLGKAEARLAAKLGQEHSRVIALKRAQARTGQLWRELRADATRTAKLRELKPYEWMVYGQVVDSKGNPIPDLIVRVFDKDRKLDDMLGYTSTDKYGDFQLVYHERAFYEPGEGAPELYLQVEDADGKVLYSTKDEIRYEGGRLEYFMIELEPIKDRG